MRYLQKLYIRNKTKKNKQCDMVKLHLGSGKNYKEGYINIDFDKNVEADMHIDLTKEIPFKDNMIEEIYMDNFLEHIPRDRYFWFMDELYRICKDKAIIKIYVPHFGGVYATKHPNHDMHFGIGSFSIYQPIEDLPKGYEERYSNSRFIVKKQRLLYFHHNPYEVRWLRKIPIDWMFNFNRKWQMIMEKFTTLKFDEIYYEIEVTKNGM